MLGDVMSQRHIFPAIPSGDCRTPATQQTFEQQGDCKWNIPLEWGMLLKFCW